MNPTMHVINKDFTRHMKYLVPACMALLLTACASPDPGPVEIEPPATPEPVVVEDPVVPEPVAVAPIDGVFFPELQGTWNRECRPFDEDEPDGSFEKSTFTVEGNDFQTNTTVYQDSGCTTELTRGFLQAGSSFQTYGTLGRPAGSAETPMGTAAFIDLSTDRHTIDNQPIIASLQGFFQPETGYSIVVVNGNQFFLGDESGGQDGESAASRPTSLDTDRLYTRQ